MKPGHAAQRAGRRCVRHINERIQCYVHERLERQQHRQFRRT
jgi:hypothetical protein